MIKKIKQRLKLYCEVRFFQYLYLNHFCKQVIRTDNSRILPYKNTCLDLAPGSRIYVGGGDLELGCDRLKGSKAETLIRLRKNSIWSCEGGCHLSYGTTLEVLEGGQLDTGFFTLNSGSVIIAAKNIQMGRDVMIGRNVLIYDSDHHSIYNTQHQVKNSDQRVHIGDHVWLTSNVSVLKGTEIGNGCVVGANSIIHGKIPPHTLYRTEAVPVLNKDFGTWEREHP